MYCMGPGTHRCGKIFVDTAKLPHGVVTRTSLRGQVEVAGHKMRGLMRFRTRYKLRCYIMGIVPDWSAEAEYVRGLFTARDNLEYCRVQETANVSAT